MWVSCSEMDDKNKSAKDTCWHVRGQVARTLVTLGAECQVHADSPGSNLTPIIEIVFYSNHGHLQETLILRKEMSPTDTLIQTLGAPQQEV